jgi:type III secretion protein C
MHKLLQFIVCVLLAAAVTAASAAGTPWTSKRFVYRADGKRIAEVFQDFAASQSLPVVVDANVEGTVNGEFNTKPEAFLDAMSKTHGLVWYFDGVTLFVYPSRVMASRVFRMRGYSGTQVRQMLLSLGLGDARFPLRFNEAEQTLLAYGPPRHIELVQTVIDTLDGGARDQVGKSIQVFPLKHAVAGDRFSGRTRVPGLASILNSVFSGEKLDSGVEALRAHASAALGTPDKARTAALAFGLGTDKPAAKDGVRDGTGRLLSPETATPAVDNERPHFQAEEATNSIIVRGTPERMKQYESLIRQLDIPQDLVEIEATIIDISSDAFDSLGIEWEFSRNGNRELTVSPGTYSSAGLNNVMSGANITTLISDAGRALLSRIRALEGGGKARIVARPKVLGSVNRLASMIDKRVASVRVAGNLDVNLFSIEAGTTVQVVPQIVTHPDRRDVRLSLFIEDGSFEGAVVDSVPIVKRTEIRTEATVREGESLLIGGISVESDSKGRAGLPGLSKIPLLGALFRHDEVKTFRSERLFLITPKVVELNRPRAEVAPPVPAMPAASEQPASAQPAPAPASAQPAPPQADPAAPSAEPSAPLTPAEPAPPQANPAAPSAEPSAPPASTPSN